MPNIIVKRYEHYSRAFGKYIGSRRQYEYEMVKGGYMPFDKAEQLAEAARERNKQKYDGLSPKAMKFLNEVKGTADKNGKIDVTDKFIQGLKDNGVKLDCMYDKLPKHYRSGGFYDEG